MRARRSHGASLAAAALALIVLACSGAPPRTEERPPPPPTEVEPPPLPPPPEPEGPVVPEDESAPEGGAACTRTSECSSGLACRGARGCESPWACGAPRESCGPDTVSYCDCDGITFHALAGCPGRTYAHVGPCEEAGIADASYGIPDGDEPITTRDRTCSSSADCRGGEICYGAPGCGMEWRCERARGCWRGGRTEFCGCDGVTFTGPRHCPGQPYARQGSCEEAVAVAETPAPPPTTTTRARPPTTSTSTAATATTTSTTARASTSVTSTTASTPPAPLAPGQCRTSRDCGRGEVCAGPAGCGDAWTCIRRTDRCNPDTQYFCDCEGHSFTASMTCPSRPYAHRGSCAIDQAMDLAGAALR